MGIFVKFSFYLRCLLTKYGHVTWPKMQISQFFLFCLNSTFNIRKVTKFPVEKLCTSEVISKKYQGGGRGVDSPTSTFRVKPLTWVLVVKSSYQLIKFCDERTTNAKWQKLGMGENTIINSIHPDMDKKWCQNSYRETKQLKWQIL